MIRGSYLLICGRIKYIDPKIKFPPDDDFRILSIFTADLSLAYTAVVNYFIDINNEYSVQLSYVCLPQETAERLLKKKTEIILLDGPKILAICSDLVLKGVYNQPVS